MTVKRNHAPEHVRGFRVGDQVLTPLNRRAVIVGIRVDGYLDARYLDVGSPTLADVILQAETLRRIQ